MTVICRLILYAFLLLPVHGWANTIEGPLEASLVRTIDGDTVVVRVSPWFGQSIEVSVRLAGINAPERRGPCRAEKTRAEAARRLLEQRIGDSPRLYLRDVRKGKYFGRVIGRLETEEGVDLSAFMLASGLAAPYNGKGRIRTICENRDE